MPPGVSWKRVLDDLRLSRMPDDELGWDDTVRVLAAAALVLVEMPARVPNDVTDAVIRLQSAVEQRLGTRREGRVGARFAPLERREAP